MVLVVVDIDEEYLEKIKEFLVKKGILKGDETEDIIAKAGLVHYKNLIDAGLMK